MEFESTPVFDNDIKKLDKNERKQLEELLEKILEKPEMGKPLEHYANVFSKRTKHRRLIYLVKNEIGKILLVMYKNREEVYEALKKIRL